MSYDVIRRPSATEPGFVAPEKLGHLALGKDHTCYLYSNGQVTCWGKNANGELGDGTTIDHSTPSLVPGLDGIVEIAASEAFDFGPGNRGSHTCARRHDGTVWCWGANVDGLELQDTITSRRLVPTKIDGFDVTPFNLSSSIIRFSSPLVISVRRM